MEFKNMKFIDYEMKQSPFHKIDGFKKTKGNDRVSVRTDIAPEDYEIIEKYIMQRDPDFDPKKKNNKFDNSKFVRELLMDFFNNITLEKKSFEDMYFVMLLPKDFDDPEDLELDGEIVGVIEDPKSFYTENWFNHFKGNRNKYNFIYNLEEFNERNYNDFLYDYHGDDPIFTCVDKSIQHDFVKVKIRLSEVYHELDIDNCYFTIFNVNNYLDVLNDGVYTQGASKFHHEGVLVFLDGFDEVRLTMTCEWSFYYNTRCALSLIVEDNGKFNEHIIDRTNNDELINEYWSITTVYTREGALERRIKDLNKCIEDCTRMRDEKQAMLDELRENNS